MIPAACDYMRPTTVDEAIAALVAGPSVVVDTTRIDELQGIVDGGGVIVIGADDFFAEASVGLANMGPGPWPRPPG